MINNGKVITDSLEKAEALNNQFYSVFTDEDLFDLPQLDQLEHPMMPEISFSISGIHSLLLNLDSNKMYKKFEFEKGCRDRNKK